MQTYQLLNRRPKIDTMSARRTAALSRSPSDRGRDMMISLLFRMFSPFFQSHKETPRLLFSPFMLPILNRLAKMYGLDIHSMLHTKGEQRALWNLLRSIAHFGIQTPQSLKAPISVVWSLSHRCNLHCMHCYQNASQPSSDELTLGEQLDVIDQLANAGVSMIVLSGGEPLTNPHLDKLIERIHMHEMAISIDSNGVLIDEQAVDRLKSMGVESVELSLDSVNAISHDRFRGLDGAFKRTLKAIELCSNAGIFTTVATTSTTLNWDDSSELINLARDHGADRVVFFDLVPAGRGRDVEQFRLTERQLVQLMALVREESSGDNEVFTELPQFVVYSASRDGESLSDRSEKALSVERYSVSSFFECGGHNNVYRKLAPYLGGCPAGRLYCNIQPNGDVTPCMFMPRYPVAGNLRTQSFEEIWNGTVFQALRKRCNLSGKCRACDFVTVCGGCRAKAAAYTGDYLASDPTCPIARKPQKILAS